MKPVQQYRRRLMQGFLGVAAARGLPNLAFAQQPNVIRLEWQQFKKTTQYRSFLNAIAAMRKNTKASSPGSLQYWANVHQTSCPHGSPYFISWHRGYLYYFEQQLRIASGDSTLNLPYWDYYSYSTLPAEFTDSSAGNPLYLARSGSNVYNALTLGPFASGVYNFQRGTSNAFEVLIETQPHNPVHDLIGGIMSTMQSPLDPIFFLHHANIDRLTHAWALPDGKGIPDTANPYSPTNSSPYWAGNNVYTASLTMERYRTLIPMWLGYDYANDNVPTKLPPLAVTAQADGPRLALPIRLPSNQRPAFKPVTHSAGRQVSDARRSLGGAAQLGFDEHSFSIRLAFDKKDARELAGLIGRRRDPRAVDGEGAARSVKLVLDAPATTDTGRLGGYFYALYLNMPTVVDSHEAQARTFIGTLGAFQIAAATHHGHHGVLEFDLTEPLSKQDDADFSEASLSCVRVDGDSPPAGPTINVQEARIELSYEAEPVEPPRLKGRKDFYH